MYAGCQTCVTHVVCKSGVNKMNVVDTRGLFALSKASVSNGQCQYNVDS